MFLNLLKKFDSFSRSCCRWCVDHAGVTLLILFVLSFGIKFTVWRLDPSVSRDASLYLHMVQNWHDTGVSPQSWIPPMLFCLMRGGMALGLDVEVSGVLINLLMGSFITVAGYGITFESTQSKKIALLAAVFFAFHPSIADLSHEVQRDVPYLRLAGITTWLAVAGIRRKKWYLWAAAGAVAAFSFMTRYETAELFPLVLAALLVCVLTKNIRWKNALGYGLSFGGFFVLTFIAFIWICGFHHIFAEYSKYYKTKFIKVTHLTEPADKKGGK